MHDNKQENEFTEEQIRNMRIVDRKEQRLRILEAQIEHLKDKQDRESSRSTAWMAGMEGM